MSDHHPQLTALSLCSGIGGLDLAVSSVLDARVVGYIERDAYCQAVLLERMEEEALEPAPIFTDLCSFDGRPWSVDLVFGGIPCQAHSVAGKQLRSADERDLVDEFLRVVGEVGPRLVFVENVRGFVSRDGLGRLLGGLAELGFDAEWQTLQAAEVGAPHRRERVFALAYARGERLEGVIPAWAASVATGRADREPPGVDPVPVLRELPMHDPLAAPCSRLPVPADRGMDIGPLLGSDWWPTCPGPLRVDARDDARVDRLRALGNAVVPAQAEAALMLLLQRPEPAEAGEGE